MTVEERKIYDLVVRRFLAVLLPAAEYDETVITAEIGGQRFTARGKVMRSQGWREAYETSAGTDSGADSSFLSFDDLDDETDEEEERGGAARVKEQTLPDIKEGAVIAGAGLSLTEGKTKPPAPFNLSLIHI